MAKTIYDGVPLVCSSVRSRKGPWERQQAAETGQTVPCPWLLGVAELVMQQPRVVSEQLRAGPHGDVLDRVCP